MSIYENLCSISVVENKSNYRSHEIMIRKLLETFFTYMKWLILHQGNGKNLSTKDAIVVSAAMDPQQLKVGVAD